MEDADTASFLAYSDTDGQGTVVGHGFILKGNAETFNLSDSCLSIKLKGSRHVLTTGSKAPSGTNISSTTTAATDQGPDHAVFIFALLGPATVFRTQLPCNRLTIDNTDPEDTRQAFIALAVETGFRTDTIELALGNFRHRSGPPSVAHRRSPVKALEPVR